MDKQSDEHFKQWWQQHNSADCMRYPRKYPRPITVIDVYEAWKAGRDYEASQIIDGLADVAERMKEDILSVRTASAQEAEARAAVRQVLGGKK